jgi:MFS transporter, DHA2 family, multidrug resistance protein
MSSVIRRKDEEVSLSWPGESLPVGHRRFLPGAGAETATPCSVFPEGRWDTIIDRTAGVSLVDAPAPGVGPTVWIGYLAMCIGMFMAILDIQIVASSLPDIAAALAIPIDRISWIQTAYLIAEIIAIPLTGWLTRLLTLRWLFVAGVAGFTMASAGCAASTAFFPLIFFRTVQGFTGGVLIPAVFTAVFSLFPERLHTRATVIAGVLAMLAPTLGPALGGYITETFTWHWIFLVNIGPGLLAATVTSLCLNGGRPDWRLLHQLDRTSLFLLAFGLAAVELGLKEAPEQGWTSATVLLLLATCLIFGFLLVRRSLRRAQPLLHFRCFADRRFAASSFLSFVLGTGLYGSIYLLPLFLALVRQHTAIEIGGVMIVTGLAQLVAAPVAALLEKRFHPCFVSALGYGLFTAGLAANGFETYESDFTAFVIPQILRGFGVMLCVLPTTTVALEGREGSLLAELSGLFNGLRNLGGAIGIAAVDTILQARIPVHAEDLVARLQAGDPEAARAVGLPVERFHGVPMGPIDQATRDFVQPLIERAAMVASFNEAWLALGLFFAIALLALPLLSRPAKTG